MHVTAAANRWPQLFKIFLCVDTENISVYSPVYHGVEYNEQLNVLISTGLSNSPDTGSN